MPEETVTATELNEMMAEDKAAAEEEQSTEEEVVEEAGGETEEAGGEEPDYKALYEAAQQELNVVYTQPQQQQNPQAIPTPKELEITEEEYSEAIQSVDGMRKLLSKTVGTIKENILLSLPAVITPAVANQVNLSQKITKFYNDNPDFLPVRGFVVAVAKDLEGKNPGLDMDNLLKKVEVEVRQRLKLAAAKAKHTALTQKRSTGGFPPKGGATKPKKAVLDPLQKEIEDLKKLSASDIL